MSLEQALADNTAALKMLTLALSSVALPQTGSLPQLTTPKSYVCEKDATGAVVLTPEFGHTQNPQPTVAPVPPPSQATPAALSIAAAVQLQTALVEQGDTSLDPKTVFGQAAATSAAPVIPAAPLTVPPAPVVNTAGTVTIAGPELDKNGLPWDGRIHASSKAKIADGSWRAKRDVDKTLVATVTAELRQALAAAPAAPAFGAWPIPAADAPDAPLQGTPPAPPAPPVSNYARLMAVLPGMMSSGLISLSQVNEELVKVGIPNVAALAARDDLVPQVASALGVAL